LSFLFAKNGDKMKCENCPRMCGVDREKSLGFCGLNDKIKIALASVHYGEEPCISGKNGSGTIFFSGCNLKCVFCQNYNLSHANFGKEISASRLAEIFKELELKGVNNINLVTPTPYVDKIIQALEIYKPQIPICYNTSGYERVEIIEKLKNYVDIYLADLKYYDKNLSKKYSLAEDYFSVSSKAILQMIKNQPQNVFNENGIMKSGVIIRHLVLPSCHEDSFKVLDWIKANVQNPLVSIMSQYTPCNDLKNYPELNKKINKIEYKLVVNHALELGLDGYMQGFESATKNQIPNFNLDGVEKK